MQNAPLASKKEMSDRDLNRLVTVRFKLAKAWHLKGNIEAAIAGYQEILQLQPNFVQAALKLGQLLREQERLKDAIAVYQKSLKFNPNEAELHKHLISTIAREDGINAAFEYYQLERKDSRELWLDSDDILCCTVTRNEAIRFPYFLSYYREKGIRQFFIIDNHSTDDTLSYLLAQPDVYVWQSSHSFNQANFGSVWFELLLRTYGLDRWCLIVDTDEIFYYPDCETKNIRQLCQRLDEQNQQVMTAVLLDMYSDRAISETYYNPGQNFLDCCPYFDRNFYHTQYEQHGPYRNQIGYFGGVRQRVFGEAGSYYLSKVPLIKYTLDRVLTGGQHYTNCPQEEIATERGCLLHFKYFSSFSRYVREETTRKEHYAGGMQYAEYANAIAQNNSLTLYNPKDSIALQNSQQLVELGIMRVGESATPPHTAPISQQPRDPGLGRILVYTDCPEIYGAAQCNHTLMSGFVSLGYRVTCAQSKASHHLIQQRESLGIEHLWLEDDNLYHPTKPPRTFCNTAEAQRIFELAKPDLILFGDGSPFSSLEAKRVAARLEIPYITLIHCATVDWAKKFASHSDQLPYLYEQAQAIITVSQENLELLRKEFKLPQNRGWVIYNGRPAQYFTEPSLEARDRVRQELAIPPEAVVCLTTARIETVKGYHYQLSAIQQLQNSENLQQLYFIWVGTGTLLPRLQAVAKELGVTERIKFVGERSDIPDLLDAADIFILPSQFEGMPLAIMEAMAKGKPVIATAVSGIPEELGNTGKLISDPKINSQATIQELANTLKHWGTEATLRHAIGQACKKRAETLFTEERMIQSYQKILDRILFTS